MKYLDPWYDGYKKNYKLKSNRLETRAEENIIVSGLYRQGSVNESKQFYCSTRLKFWAIE